MTGPAMFGRHAPHGPPPVVRDATLNDLADVVRLLTLDLATRPRSAWALPSHNRRPLAWRAYLTEIAVTALDTGRVHLTSDRTAVAVWRPHPHPTDDAALDATLDAAIDAAEVSPVHCLRVFHTILQAGYPADAHDDLVHLAVHPDWCGRGLATALLRHHHAHLDQARTPAVAHVDDDGPHRLLHHLGYTTVVPATVPADLPLTMLARPPRP